LRSQELGVQIEPEGLFKSGERVRITTYPFADIEGIYQMTDADQPVDVLIELIGKSIKIMISPSALKKVS
jgi:transcription antitermination factor NusG